MRVPGVLDRYDSYLGRVPLLISNRDIWLDLDLSLEHFINLTVLLKVA